MMQLHEDEDWDKHWDSDYRASPNPRTPGTRRSPAHGTAHAAPTQEGMARAAPTQDAAAMPTQDAAPMAPAPLPPLTADNARRRLVIVSSARYPRHACNEHGGQGWEAQILSATRVSAVVRYLRARTIDGRPYEDTREPLASLRPIT